MKTVMQVYKKRVLFGPQVLELQDCVSRLQTLNNELQNRLSVAEKSDHGAYHKEDKDVARSSPLKQVRGHKTCKWKSYLKLRHQSSTLQLKDFLSHQQIFAVCPHFPNT